MGFHTGVDAQRGTFMSIHPTIHSTPLETSSSKNGQPNNMCFRRQHYWGRRPHQWSSPPSPGPHLAILTILLLLLCIMLQLSRVPPSLNCPVRQNMLCTLACTSRQTNSRRLGYFLLLHMTKQNPSTALASLRTTPQNGVSLELELPPFPNMTAPHAVLTARVGRRRGEPPVE